MMYNCDLSFSSYKYADAFYAPACFAASDNIFFLSGTVITAVSVFLSEIIVQILKNSIHPASNIKSKLPIIKFDT